MVDPEAAKENIQSLYLARTGESRRLFQWASKVLPLGVSGGGKFHSPYPIYVSKADGALVWDVDGNEYVDFLMGAGATLFGHRHPAIIAAVQAQLDIVTDVFAPTRAEIELAHRIAGFMPHLERIRFANTGSEAVRTCLRAARAFTGRTGVAKFEGGYDGSDDPFLVSVISCAGPPDRPASYLDSAGVPEYIARDVLVLPYNDGPACVRLIEQNADRLAAVFVEPVGFFQLGAIPASPEFVRDLRDVTERHGILLVFDEVVTGFRLGLGGAPSYLGVTPDLTAFGKALGGGFPIAAFGGRADVMEAVLGLESLKNGKRIFHSGTYTAHPISVAVALAGLRLLETEPVLETINALGERFRAGLRELFEDAGIEARVTGAGSIFHAHFTDNEPRSRRDIVNADSQMQQLFLTAILTEGVLWPLNHPGVISYAHHEADIDRALSAVARTLPLLAAPRSRVAAIMRTGLDDHGTRKTIGRKRL